MPIDLLIDVSVNTIDNDETIHADFESNEFGSPPVKRLLWGEFKNKPVVQIQWEQDVARASVMAAAAEPQQDVRPRIKDLISGKLILIDTGASVSVWPVSDFPDAKMDAKVGLKALDGTNMPTFGQRQVKIKLNRKVFVHTFTLARVQSPICGWDYLTTFQLDLLWTSGKCVLFCNKTRSQYNLKMGKSPTRNLSLSTFEVTENVDSVTPLSFKKYWESKKTAPKPTTIPSKYQALLDKFKGVLECIFDRAPKHNISHKIETGDNAPCKAKPRPLLEGSPKAIHYVVPSRN